MQTFEWAACGSRVAVWPPVGYDFTRVFHFEVIVDVRSLTMTRGSLLFLCNLKNLKVFRYYKHNCPFNIYLHNLNKNWMTCASSTLLKIVLLSAMCFCVFLQRNVSDDHMPCNLAINVEYNKCLPHLTKLCVVVPHKCISFQLRRMPSWSRLTQRFRQL